jgi:hypothetical protein
MLNPSICQGAQQCPRPATHVVAIGYRQPVPMCDPCAQRALASRTHKTAA